jgi:serine/threonine protein kinase/tetratricopeptide (TPR) repeat protein
MPERDRPHGPSCGRDGNLRGHPMIGTTVSHYRILEKLGEGGMGVVYRAIDTRLRRTVALKFLPPELTRDEDAKERFIQEARSASALDHPNICTIHDVDETEDGRIFISMACYDGETAKRKIKGGLLSYAEAIDFTLQVARGLSKAHAQGIVHRDIKPANLFITKDKRVKILDFGLAKLAGQTRMTKVGSTVGTVSYMSPEQARGREVDRRTDIWSLGVVLYEMITGKRPFGGENEQAVLYNIINSEPAPVGELRDDIPPLLGGIIRKCLTKDPARRYQTVSDLMADLRGFDEVLTSSTTAIGIPGFGRLRSKAARRGTALAAALVVVAALLLNPQVRGQLANWFGPRVLPREKHLAVLPFNTGDPGNEDVEAVAFREGFGDYVTFRLGQLEQFDGSFWAIAADGSETGEPPTPARARGEHGVTLALTGTVDREENVVRANLALVNAETERVLTRFARTERIGNVSALQDELVTGLVEALEIDLDENECRLLTAGGTTLPAAFDAYVRGRGHLVLAKAEDREGVDRAIALFEEALVGDPRYVLALAGLGEAYWQKCRITKEDVCRTLAIESLERAIGLDDRLAITHLILGKIHATTGTHEEAAREFERAIEIDPSNVAALFKLGDAQSRLGEPALSEETYQRAIDLRPAYWRGYSYLGYFYRTQGRYEDAAAQFKKVIKLVPESAIGYQRLGVVYYDLERYEDSLVMLAAANDIAPSSMGYSNLGTLYFQRGRYADAAVMYEKALELHDTDYRIWGNLGSSYRWMPGEEEKTLAAFGRAVELAEEDRTLSPSDPMLLCLLAGYYAELGDREKALGLTEEALSVAGDDIEIMFQAGHHYEVLGERESALDWIGGALERGYSREQVERTPALRGFCNDERYQRLVNQLEARSR